MDEDDKEEVVIYPPPVGSLWRHYKGTVYEVVGMAHDANNDGNRLVLYRAAAQVPGMVPKIWARPVEEWHDKRPHIVEPGSVFRFVRVVDNRE